MTKMASKLKRLNAKRVAVSGVMLALALIVSLVENMIPPIVPMLPYAKLGLVNVVLLACFLLVGVWEGYVILILKCLMSAVYAGNVAMLLWSVPASLVSYTIMVLLHRTKLFSVTGLSMAGGILHNFTQILVATIVVGKSVFFYLPYMLLAGGVAGLITGVACHFAVAGLKDVIRLDKGWIKRRVEQEDTAYETEEQTTE
jgi:heptaprenyl diphosphate synthase